jgi:hypothetical protein
MPKDATSSPPKPSFSSDDEDFSEVRGRWDENLKASYGTFSKITQHRDSSPKNVNARDLLVLASQTNVITERIYQDSSIGLPDDRAQAARRIARPELVVEPSFVVSKYAESSLAGSEENFDGELHRKPQMVRKRSGKLVRPALRSPSRRRPSSMPGTPTFSKSVHFDSHIEDVRHFLQVDRPLVVSEGSSPVDNYDSGIECSLPREERPGRTPSQPCGYEIIVTKFSVETPAQKDQPVRPERVWLSRDQKCLMGSIIAANLAFQKYVTCRFTLDYWKTTSEVAAEYMAEIQPQETPYGHDRFAFTIELPNLAILESKTLYFCIRYNVMGYEFWNNNGGTNFQVDFKKKLPQNGKEGLPGPASRLASSLLQSTHQANQPIVPRHKSMSVGAGEFGDSSKINFRQSIHEYLGEAGPLPVRLKSLKSATNLLNDNFSCHLTTPSGYTFASRYDFGASLTAAVQAARNVISEPNGLYVKGT